MKQIETLNIIIIRASSCKLGKKNKHTAKIPYDIRVDIKFIEKTSEQNSEISFLLFLYLAPSLIAYVLIPNPASSVK